MCWEIGYNINAFLVAKSNQISPSGSTGRIAHIHLGRPSVSQIVGYKDNEIDHRLERSTPRVDDKAWRLVHGIEYSG